MHKKLLHVTMLCVAGHSLSLKMEVVEVWESEER